MTVQTLKNPRLILIDGERLPFTAHTVNELGIVIISGRDGYLLHQHDITELDGQPIHFQQIYGE